MDTRASGLSGTIQTVTSGSSSSVMSGHAVSTGSSSSNSTTDVRVAMVTSSLTSDSSSTNRVMTTGSPASFQTYSPNEMRLLNFIAKIKQANPMTQMVVSIVLMIPEDTQAKESIKMSSKRIALSSLFIHDVGDIGTVLNITSEALKAGYHELSAIEKYLAFEAYMGTEMNWEEAIKAARADEDKKKLIEDIVSSPEAKLLRKEVEALTAEVEVGTDSKKSLEMLKTTDQKTQNAVGQIWSAQIEERRKQDEEQSSCCML